MKNYKEKKIIQIGKKVRFICKKYKTKLIINDNPFIAKKLNADRIELFTGPYAKEFPNDRYRAIEQYVKCSEVANDIDIEINAGHDLNQNNLKFFCQSVKNTKEVSIGHALITESLYNGLESTIKSYLQILKWKSFIQI